MFRIFRRVKELESQVKHLTDENRIIKFRLENEPKFKINTKYEQGVCISVNIVSKEDIERISLYGCLMSKRYGYEYRFQLDKMVSVIEDFENSSRFNFIR